MEAAALRCGPELFYFFLFFGRIGGALNWVYALGTGEEGTALTEESSVEEKEREINFIFYSVLFF